MADGALEITRAIREVYGEELTDRLMCWSHNDNAYKPKLKTLKKASPMLASKLEYDIQKIQWMVSSQENFRDFYNLLERRTPWPSTLPRRRPCSRTSSSTKKQWGHKSHVAKWHEAAKPFDIGSNQGVKSKNGVIKKEGVHLQGEAQHGRVLQAGQKDLP